jgi:DNA-binding MarR family transcriptional regulator
MSSATAKQTHESRTGEEEFIASLRSFLGAVRAARGRVVREASELSLSQHDVLLALADRGELRVGEVADAAGIAAPTATRMLDGLERAGIVERTASAEDRRAVTVKLTGEGRKLLERKRKHVAKRLSSVYEALEPSQREQAPELFRSLAEAIEAL